MKKKIILSSIVGAFLGLLVSCSEDDLKLQSPNEISLNDYYKTEADFQSAILGVYNDFRKTGLYCGSGDASDLIIFGDILSDNLIINPYRTAESNYAASNWNFTGASNGTSLYESAYKAISDANLLLSKIDNLSDNSSIKQKIKAEAKALRALAHFEVAKLFAKIPTQSSDALSSQGIAYVTNFDVQAKHQRENNIGIVYDKIVEDLEEALEYLPTGYSPVGDGVYRLTQNSVKGFLAKVYLFMGNYSKAIEYATPVVSAVSPTDKSILSTFWRSETNTGALFVLPFSNTSDIPIGDDYSQGSNTYDFNARYTIDKSFAESFDQETDAERYNASVLSIVQSVYDNVGPIYAVNKYISSRSGFRIGLNDARYLRVEEVILILAEAQYLSGNQSGALTTLNKLRDARYSSYAGGETGDNLFNAIIDERRKELAFENGDRFFTLKRLLGVSGIPTKYKDGIQRSGNGHRADGSGTPSAAQKLEANSIKWQLPIKQATLNLDELLGQTNGY